VPFLHILSIIFFVGVQISLASVLYVLRDAENKAQLLSYFHFFKIAFVILLFAVGGIGANLASSNDLKFADPMIEGIFLTQYAVVLFIVINFVYISYKFRLIQNAENYDEIKEHLIIVGQYFVPLNICASIFAVFLGVAIGVFA